MSVRKLVGVTTRRKCKYLVAKANSQDGLGAIGKQASHLLDERTKVLWVSRSIANQNAVGLLGKWREVKVPGRSNHAHMPPE